MRRRWLLIGTAAGVPPILIVVALAVSSARAPYRFLDGQEPVKLANVSGMPDNQSFYCVRASFDEFHGKVEAELSKSGFNVTHVHGQRKRNCTYRRGGFGPYGNVVVILENSRPVGNSLPVPSVPSIDAPGYVQVLVIQPYRDGLWDQIKAMFGL